MIEFLGLFITILIAILLIAFFIGFESQKMSSKNIALISMLGTISSVIRVPFVAIPGVQPCTFIIICSGFVYGPIAGFMVGCITPLISNLFLGHGPWTLFQMLSWGLIGFLSGLLRIVRPNPKFRSILIFGLICGYIFGVIMNLWFWTYFIYPLTLESFILVQISSLWTDTAHSIGNFILLGLFGMKTILILERFKRRFMWEELVERDMPSS
ncbi:MAG: ECF transporter S component [Halobacteriota archaeon]|nr:ECF transporter S component [Halobacteriota archaeon]